jgi:hypothetical protein
MCLKPREKNHKQSDRYFPVKMVVLLAFVALVAAIPMFQAMLSR